MMGVGAHFHNNRGADADEKALGNVELGGGGWITIGDFEEVVGEELLELMG